MQNCSIYHPLSSTWLLQTIWWEVGVGWFNSIQSPQLELEWLVNFDYNMFESGKTSIATWCWILDTLFQDLSNVDHKWLKCLLKIHLKIGHYICYCISIGYMSSYSKQKNYFISKMSSNYTPTF